MENGEGSYLSQDTVRELVDYCKERKLNVIPEVPSLSHCDYLVMSHPEIREREEDPYPDTYCPSNPKSYELLFDVLDEVIEVFEPQIINIGHDEYYSIGICDKCKGKKAEEIFAEDIKKIHAYLAQKGIKTMIWGEKLLNARGKDGRGIGGAEVRMYQAWDMEKGEFLGIIPATYKAIDLVPKDLEILHWYWSIDEKLEEAFHERGLRVTYGNYRGSKFTNWHYRIGRGVVGGIISNWSSLREENLQRNGVLFEIVFSAQMFWNRSYDESRKDELVRETFEELFRYKQSMLSKRKGFNELKEEMCRYIKVLHTTDKRIEYKQFVDGVFIEKDVYKLGDYVILYEDGTEA
ncbi:MAG TPA: family 20 glycosylhydrolase [Cytophagaceae bacterium]